MPEDLTRFSMIVEWVIHQPMLIQHIQNGVARGLYPQGVADQVQSLIIERNKQLDSKEAAA